MHRFVAAAALLTVAAPALAGPCDTLINKATSLEGEALVANFEEVLACDKGEAEAAYLAYVKQSKDVETLAALSLAAIENQAFDPVWKSLEKVDYASRDDVATAIGATCTDNPNVIVFLKGAYFGLRNMRFSQWDDAYAACPSEEVDAWLEGLVTKPPESAYDEKYGTILSIWTDRRGADALTALEKAAVVAAGNGGPFSAILEAMNTAVAPAYGKEMSEDHKKRLQSTLVDVAGSVSPDKAKEVADRLYNAGAESEAVSLLPAIYGDRIQEDGGFIYGAAAIESCDGEAVIHYRVVYEPAKRWSIIGDVEATVRDAKSKLKCEAETPWPVVATPEPVADDDAVDDWADGLEAKWAEKDFDAKAKSRKDIELK